ncbi:hypothetical protein DTO002I6_9861 [Penicillium roqueforti]|nr:hypothetical protein DTO002I6_9861 [Penicillium roqueforti]
MDSSITSSLPKDYSSFASAATLYIKSPSRQRYQKKISITQTYYLAHTVRKKLYREASRTDHDLRLLVGHANLLDSLTLEYADTKRDHEQWFNNTVNGATKASQDESRHIQWASTVVEEAKEDWNSEDASDLESDFSESEEDESDFDEPDFVINTPIRRRAPSPVAPTPKDLLEEDVGDYTDSNFEFNDTERFYRSHILHHILDFLFPTFCIPLISGYHKLTLWLPSTCSPSHSIGMVLAGGITTVIRIRLGCT